MDSLTGRPTYLREGVSFDAAINDLKRLIGHQPETDAVHSYVAGVVVLCVARMESLANLVLSEGFRLFGREVAETEHGNILEKAQLIAGLIFERSLARGEEPHQSLQDIRALRNGLVHHKPEKEPLGYTREELRRAPLSSRFAARWEFCYETRNARSTSQLQSILTPECAEWAMALVPVYRDILEFGVTAWEYRRPAQFDAAMPADFSYDEARKTYLGKLHNVDTSKGWLFPEHESRDRKRE